MKTKILIGAAVLTFVALPQTHAAEDVLKTNFTVGLPTRLVMDVDRGNIEVKVADGKEVTIEARRKLDRFSDADAAEVFRDHVITFSQNANEVIVKAEAKKSLSSRKLSRLQVYYTVTVPKQCSTDLFTRGGAIGIGDIVGPVKMRSSGGNLKTGKIDESVQANTSGGAISVAAAKTVTLETSGGNIEVGTIAGDVSVNTSGGGIRIDNSKGNVVAKTSGGNIRVGEVTGNAELNTSGGSIAVKHVGGKLDASSSGGNIEIASADSPSVVKTSGGAIQVNLTKQPTGDVHIETAAGSIILSAPATIAVDIDAKTSAGNINSDLPVTVQGKHNRSSLVGKVNGGGPKLVLITHGGNITIKSADATAKRD
jgi:DUF4097 and DUF4098 domain-containing protein YvlB